MTDNKIIASIKRNGGWCQLYRLNFFGGRLLFYNNELSFIEKFDVSTYSLKGYVVVLNNTKQRLERAYWIKKILRIGGKVIREGHVPDTIFAESLDDFLQKFISSKEPLLLRFLNGKVRGYARGFSDSDLKVDILSPHENFKQMTIPFSEIICLELRTPTEKYLK